MKQHITVEQFYEIEPILNPDLEEPNIFWRYKLEEYDICVDNCGDEFIAEQFTIGKMFEILKEYEADINIYRSSNQITLWNATLCLFENQKEQLCDTLWEAIKYMLKN